MLEQINWSSLAYDLGIPAHQSNFTIDEVIGHIWSFAINKGAFEGDEPPLDYEQFEKVTESESFRTNV